MGFTPEDIKELREKSGAGMMDCKKALDESDGDVEKAIDWLRKKGINTAQKKSSRSASDGLVTSSIKKDCGVLIEVNAETDFVARNENFQNFCNELSLICIENKIKNVESLLNSKHGSSNQTVQERLTEIISKLGENIIIRKLSYFGGEENYLQKYIHNSINENSGKIGVLMSYSSNNRSKESDEFSKNICMHIAAADPKSLDINSLDEQLIEKERQIYKEQLKSTNKPENIIEKIIDGKIKKFYEEVCLMEQYFVMENKIQIKNCIENFNKEFNDDFKIVKFEIFKLGQ
jgi:elongation factor Ts